MQTQYFLANTYDDDTIPVSEQAYRLLSQSDGQSSIGELMPPAADEEPEPLLNELYSLWSLRALKCSAKTVA